MDDLSFPRPSSIRFLILSCALSAAMFGLIATPALTQNTGDSSSSRCSQTKTLDDYQRELRATPRSSLANYCEGELFFAQRNYQASINAYHASLSGDGDPSWTKVWSHIQFGKIADIAGERERAIEHYRLAIQTGDNTGNAIGEGSRSAKTPFPTTYDTLISADVQPTPKFQNRLRSSGRRSFPTPLKTQLVCAAHCVLWNSRDRKNMNAIARKRAGYSDAFSGKLRRLGLWLQ